MGEGWECYGYDRYCEWETAGSVMDMTGMASGKQRSNVSSDKVNR